MPIEAMIRSDKDTITKLRKAAGGKPLGQYLREIATGVIETPPTIDELEVLRGSVLKQLDMIKQTLDKVEQLTNSIAWAQRALANLMIEVEAIGEALDSNPKQSAIRDKVRRGRYKARWSAEQEGKNEI